MCDWKKGIWFTAVEPYSDKIVIASLPKFFCLITLKVPPILMLMSDE